MAKITLTRPFLVCVLSVLTAVLLWQDVSAQSTEREPQSRTQSTDTAEPEEAPAEAVPEAKLAPELINGTMTGDGETRSIVVEACALYPGHEENQRVIGRGKDDAGNSLNFDFNVGAAYYRCQETRHLFAV